MEKGCDENKRRVVKWRGGGKGRGEKRENEEKSRRLARERKEGWREEYRREEKRRGKIGKEALWRKINQKK